MPIQRIEHYKIFIGAIALFASVNAAAQNCLLIVGTIHGAHKTNINYPYEAIWSLFQRWVPDAIGVEVRPEDVLRPSSELRRFYPEEMANIKDLFSRTSVFGFDWFGDEWAGQMLPDDAFEMTEANSRNIKLRKIKILEKNMKTDRHFKHANRILGGLHKQRAVAVQTFSMPEINGGKYADISNAYYTYLNKVTAGTKYQEMTDFYQSRDKRLADNIAAVLEKLEGKKVAVLTGADHRDKVVHLLRQKFPPKVLAIANANGAGCGNSHLDQITIP